MLISAVYRRETGLNIHSYGRVFTGVMVGVALAPATEAALLSRSATTCTPSTVEGAELGPTISDAEEGIDVSVSGAGAETAAPD
jgi:hypothetical protein